MTPRDIIVGLRGAGTCPVLPRGGVFLRCWRILRPGDKWPSALILMLEMEAVRENEACIQFLRAEFQPWQPARCLVVDEIAEMIGSAFPDADPDTLGMLRSPIEAACATASMQVLMLIAAGRRA